MNDKHPYDEHPYFATTADSSNEFGSNVSPDEKTLYANRYAVDATLAQIRLAWQRFENATTMGEIQSALSEVSRLVHDGH